MKTTLDLPIDLIREIKTRAIHEGQKLKDAVAELLRKGLAAESVEPGVRQVKLPLVECRHQANLSPQAVADILTQQEADWSHDSLGH